MSAGLSGSVIRTFCWCCPWCWKFAASSRSGFICIMQLIVQWVLCCRESAPLKLSTSLSHGDVDFQIARNLFELTRFEFSVSWAKQRERSIKTGLHWMLHFTFMFFLTSMRIKPTKQRNNKKQKPFWVSGSKVKLPVSEDRFGFFQVN